MAGLVAKATSSGTPAFSRRASSKHHSSGKYNCQATGRLPAWQASVTLTATWQLSCLPSIPQY